MLIGREQEQEMTCFMNKVKTKKDVKIERKETLISKKSLYLHLFLDLITYL